MESYDICLLPIIPSINLLFLCRHGMMCHTDYIVLIALEDFYVIILEGEFMLL